MGSVLTDVGRNIIIKNMANGKPFVWTISIGNGHYDTGLLAPIAPATSETILQSEFFRDQQVQTINPTTAGVGSSPAIFFRHTFINQNVPATGTAISFISEAGLFLKDFDSGLFTLVWLSSFQKFKFRVPATGTAVVRDAPTLTGKVLIL